MAEIPVERKEGGGGIPWWVWALLAALIAALVIWWVADDKDERVEPVGIEATEPATVAPTTTQ